MDSRNAFWSVQKSCHLVCLKTFLFPQSTVGWSLWLNTWTLNSICWSDCYHGKLHPQAFTVANNPLLLCTATAPGCFVVFRILKSDVILTDNFPIVACGTDAPCAIHAEITNLSHVIVGCPHVNTWQQRKARSLTHISRMTSRWSDDLYFHVTASASWYKTWKLQSGLQLSSKWRSG
jgi:hypothetical protein